MQMSTPRRWRHHGARGINIIKVIVRTQPIYMTLSQPATASQPCHLEPRLLRTRGWSPAWWVVIRHPGTGVFTHWATMKGRQPSFSNFWNKDNLRFPVYVHQRACPGEVFRWLCHVIWIFSISSTLHCPERSFAKVSSNECPSENSFLMESWLQEMSLGRIFHNLSQGNWTPKSKTDGKTVEKRWTSQCKRVSNMNMWHQGWGKHDKQISSHNTQQSKSEKLCGFVSFSTSTFLQGFFPWLGSSGRQPSLWKLPPMDGISWPGRSEWPQQLSTRVFSWHITSRKSEPRHRRGAAQELQRTQGPRVGCTRTWTNGFHRFYTCINHKSFEENNTLWLSRFALTIVTWQIF